MSRHDTIYLPCILTQEKVVMCCRACRTAWRDSHDMCLGASSQRGLGWTCPPHFFERLFLRLMQIHSTKDYTCTRKHYCFFVVCHVGTRMVRHAQHMHHNMHGMHCRTRTKCCDR